nr:aminoglycoside adenylyltransferase domain-containing protein [Enterovirga sp. DB1703]
MAQAQAAAGQVPCGTSRARPSALSSYVLGIARLHFTLATATLTSKTKAGLYGIVTFDGEWTPIIDAALRVRRDPLSATSDLSYDRATDFIRMVVHDMHGLASVA